MMMLYFGINFILLMFTYVLVYMLEKTFGYVSSIAGGTVQHQQPDLEEA